MGKDDIQTTRNQRQLEGSDEVRTDESRADDVRADEVRRFNALKSFHNLVVVLLMFVEPISNILASFADQGRHLVDSFVHWVQTYLEGFGQYGRQAHICKRVRSRDLKSLEFLGQGFSGFIYETTWSTWYGKKNLGRFARKDFPGVESEVFEHEAARLMNLHHSNVVKVFCWTVDRLGCSLVLEFVSNDLESVVEQRKVKALRQGPWGLVFDFITPFKLVKAIYIMLHIARAIEYLHSKGVAHGDLRPNNVLVNLKANPMIVKVVDFGLIESKKRTTLVSKRARFLQTLEWKAPETLKDFPAYLSDSSNEYLCEEMDSVKGEGRLTVADELADVYSFAIMCTYILGGTISYPKSNLTELQHNISSGTLRPVIPDTCPMYLKELIQSSWDSNPARRPRSFELLKILQQQYTTLLEGTVPGIVQDMPKIRGPNRDLAREFQAQDVDVSMYKVFLSYSGAQKDFVEQLCEDLVRVSRYPFYDKHRKNLRHGVSFPADILEAIRYSSVGVVVLSDDFFTRSKWPMLEMITMVQSRKEKPEYKIIPVFLGISPRELVDPMNHQRWQSVWTKWAENDSRVILNEWMEALKELRMTSGLVCYHGMSMVDLRAQVVEAICELGPPERTLVGGGGLFHSGRTYRDLST